MTVGDVVDRVFRTYLETPDSQPVSAVLSSSVDEAATAWTVDTSASAPEELSLLGPGVLIEADYELVRVVSFDPQTGALTVRRAAAGTTAASHNSGLEMRVAPAFSRQSVFDAVADDIARLWPDLWTAKVVRVSIGSDGMVSLPVTDFGGLLSVQVDGQPAMARPVWGLFDPDVGLHFPPGSRGLATVTYRARAVRPSSPSDTLASLNVDEGWVGIIEAGAVARLVLNRDVERQFAEHLMETLELQFVEVGRASSVSTAFLRLRQLLVAQARLGLQAQYRPQIRMRSAF